MNIPSVEWVIEEMTEKKYIMVGKPWQVNVIGVRSIPNSVNSFDDYIGVVYRKDENGPWKAEFFAGTTDPGRYWLQNPMNIDGTAVVIPGQYKNSHRIGLHKGDPALKQSGNLNVWRDANKDGVVDYSGRVYTATPVSGIDVHHAGLNSVQVDKWSAGCQVIAKRSDWDRFWTLVDQSATKYGTLFDYTLLSYSEPIRVSESTKVEVEAKPAVFVAPPKRENLDKTNSFLSSRYKETK